MLRQKIGVDIGRNSLRVAVGDSITQLPTAALVEKNRVLAVGEKAQRADLENKQRRVRAFSGGRVCHSGALRFLLKEALTVALPWYSVLSPHVVMARSQLTTPADWNLVLSASKAAGCGAVTPADSLALAALGSGIDPANPKARLILYSGDSTIEMGVLSNGRVVKSAAQPGGGVDLAEQVSDSLREEDIEISQSQGENLLTSVATLNGDKSTKLRVKSISDNTYKDVAITSDMIAPAVTNFLGDFAADVIAFLESMSVTLLTDISQHNVVLTGGLAKIPGVAQCVENKLEIAVKKAADPELAIISGAKKSTAILDEYNVLKRKNAKQNRHV